MPKETYIPKLFSLFRQYGYDGATLSKISEATGLGKASLYHHFPGGKDEMVEAVLAYSRNWFKENVESLLTGAGTPEERLQQMCDHIDKLYACGTEPCVLAILQAGTGRDQFHPHVKTALAAWIDAIATVLGEAGCDESLARQRGEDAIIAIQGALIVSQSLDNPALFQRVIQTLPQRLLKE